MNEQFKTYSELKKLTTIQERFRYCQTNSEVGTETFGSDRYLNQNFYTSNEWKIARRKAIIRDNGCEFGLDGFEIPEGVIIIVHHLNPVTKYDLLHNINWLLDLDNLITVSYNTHQLLHYGKEEDLDCIPNERYPGDTILW